MTTKTDEQLFIDLAQEDPGALDEIYRRHAARVLGFIMKHRSLSRERAEDVTQIVFMQLYRKRHQYRPEHAALAWVYVVTKSELRDYLARESRHLDKNHSPLSQPEAPTPNWEERDEARALLERLSEKDRDLVERRYLRDQDFDEIARDLGTSPVNVRQLISRALRKLRGAT